MYFPWRRSETALLRVEDGAAQPHVVLSSTGLSAAGPSSYLVAVGCSAGAGQQQREDRALQLLAHLPQEVPEGAAWQQTSQTGSRETEL